MTTSAHYSSNLFDFMHPSLISASELQSLLSSPAGKSTVIIDCRAHLLDKSLGQQQYRQGHLPGAYYFDLERDLSSPVQTHGGRHPLPDLLLLQEKFRRAGINQHSRVVVYDDSRMAYASRAWWLLRYMGHEDVRILNGGFKAWVAINGQIDRREPPAKPGNFKLQLNSSWTIDRNDILAGKPALLIDSREPRRYQGLEEPIDPVAGHIPGAVNYCWQNVTDDQGYIKPLEWQREYWQALAGQPHLTAYCGSGVTACVNIFSLHLCGIEARLYPGSWSDWCSYMTAPV